MGEAGPRLQGAPNFRDFGGVPAGGAFVVASGRLFRSDLLKDATNADLEILQHLGIKGVCDLRSAKERVRHANRWPEGSPVTAIGPVPEPGLEAVQAGNLRDRIIADEFDPAEAREALAAGYRQMPVSLGPSLRAVFEYLLETEAAPVLIHCTSGKDRSGFMAAMVLTALGAPREAILAAVRARAPDGRADPLPLSWRLLRPAHRCGNVRAGGIWRTLLPRRDAGRRDFCSS